MTPRPNLRATLSVVVHGSNEYRDITRWAAQLCPCPQRLHAPPLLEWPQDTRLFVVHHLATCARQQRSAEVTMLAAVVNPIPYGEDDVAADQGRWA